MSFALDIAQFVKKTNLTIEKTVFKIIIGLGESCVMQTPVGDPKIWLSLHPYTDLKSGKEKTTYKPPAGYVGGRARNNWQYGFGAMPQGVIAAADATGDGSKARLRAGLIGSPIAGIHYVMNNLPYIERLENGWSRQAPSGMVGLTLVRFGAISREAAQ